MILGALIGAVFLAFWCYKSRFSFSNDSAVYMMLTGGEVVSSPFRWRMGLPAVCQLFGFPTTEPVPVRPHHNAVVYKWCPLRPIVVWSVISYLSMIGSAALVYRMAENHGAPGWLATTLFCTLSWYRLVSCIPILTDQTGMFLALLTASLPFPYNIPVAIAAGLTHERSAVFAACFSLSPWPLVGLVGPALIAWLGRSGPVQVWEKGITDIPLKSARERWERVPLWGCVLPWGAALLGIAPTWQCAITLAVAYGQTFVAVDRVRLYQWASPVLVVPAAAFMGQLQWGWMMGILILHVIIPTSDARA